MIHNRRNSIVTFSAYFYERQYIMSFLTVYDCCAKTIILYDVRRKCFNGLKLPIQLICSLGIHEEHFIILGLHDYTFKSDNAYIAIIL